MYACMCEAGCPRPHMYEAGLLVAPASYWCLMVASEPLFVVVNAALAFWVVLTGISL